MTLRALASNDDRIIEYFRAVSEGARVSKSKKIFEVLDAKAHQIETERLESNLQLIAWSKLAKLSWRPFEEAREFVRALNLKNREEWCAFCKSGQLPADIPLAPDQRYKDKGWTSWGDWLGTGFIAPRLRQYRSFVEAREFARALNLKSGSEWLAFCKSEKLPTDIPADPNQTYKFKGWTGMGDWLGTGSIASYNKKYRPFNDARKYARALNLNKAEAWRAFCKLGTLPPDIPANPPGVYKDKGWKHWGDWLGTQAVSPKFRNYLSFELARKYVRSLGLKNFKEWQAYLKLGKLAKGIPTNPNRVYEKNGWKGYGDWLGTYRIAAKLKKYRPFKEAREFARSLNLKNREEWEVFCKSGKLPPDIPANPNQTYKDKGWRGLGDWLGTGTIANFNKKYRTFNAARKFARSLNLKSGSEWSAFCKSEKLPPDIPAKPNQTYKDKGWIGMGDWLGTYRIAAQLKKYRPFKEAREFARSLNLKNRSEWLAFCKSGKLPSDIPATPDRTYKDKGWIGLGDWLGTGTIAVHRRQRRTINAAYRTFNAAREFARSLNLKNSDEWRAFCKSGKLPSDIPTNPNRIYKDKGWIGLGDWLGTGTIASYNKKYRSFEEAREFTRSLNLTNQKAWQVFCTSGKLPADIPSHPDQIYKEKGWIGLRDWLGTENIATRNKKYRTFNAAREFARSLNLKNRNEWIAFCKSGKLPADIPATPNNTYKDKGWKSMGDWLGTGTIAPRLRQYRTFNAAREFARSLNLKNENEWSAFCKSGKLPADI
ncbi:hypothetical protein OAM21_04160, partial [Verrucomicrobia bacterium]|nr:hypothetical protein [Verrucomicrobiota bacterium]